MTQFLSDLWLSLSAYALHQSRQIARFVEDQIDRLALGWMGVVALIALIKIVNLGRILPQAISLANLPSLLLPYLLIGLAPLLALVLATHTFPAHGQGTQPRVRLARLGRWQQLRPDSASQNPGYGIEGFLASLVGGLLISILVRLAEYSMSMPAVPDKAPIWALALFRVMTLDLVTLSFLYSLCLVMALRGAPLFPRMLVYTWLYDLLMQLMIAKYSVATGELPGDIAMALQSYLDGNIKKVLISVAIWLPYLLMSKRINLTFRHRLRLA